jgi:hypothetical protein
MFAAISELNREGDLEISADISKRIERFLKLVDSADRNNMTRFCDNLYSILVCTEKENKIQQVIKCITKKVNSTPSKQIPRSLSLSQYFLAILVENKIVILPLKKHYCHITEELITLYPNFFGNIDSVFQYEN